MVMAQGGYGMPAGLDANGYVLPTGQATSGLGGAGGGGGIGNTYQSQQQPQQPQQPWQPLQSQAQTYNLGFGGMNPYTQGAVNNTMGDMARNYNLINRPQQETSMVNSGSFGNSGLQQMRQNDDYNQLQNMGNVAANMQNNAYLGQQQFGLQAQNQQYNQQMGNQQFGLQANNQDFNQALAAGNFGLNAQNQYFNQGMANNQFGLQAQNQGFNQNLAADQNRYNQNMGWANYGLGAQNQMFNQGMAQNQFDANQYWTGQNFDANRYDTSFNQNRQNLGDYMAMMNQANQFGQQDITNGTAIQNTPLDYFGQFNNMANAVGNGFASSTSNTAMPGNPLLGALGGWSLANGMTGSK